jgi:hypothetical protein
MVDPAAAVGIQVGLPQLRAGLSRGGQFLVRDIAPGIELCRRIKTMGEIGSGDGPANGKT